MTEYGLRSGELAAAAGVNPQTLRYYERRGLWRPCRTTHRRRGQAWPQ
ncbi:MAG: MerR family DNA-binding transcriptional regulator [Pseudonocardia sp.]